MKEFAIADGCWDWRKTLGTVGSAEREAVSPNVVVMTLLGRLQSMLSHKQYEQVIHKEKMELIPGGDITIPIHPHTVGACMS